MNAELYGQRWENKQVLKSGLAAPAGAAKLLAALNKYSPRETR